MLGLKIIIVWMIIVLLDVRIVNVFVYIVIWLCLKNIRFLSIVYFFLGNFKFIMRDVMKLKMIIIGKYVG